MADIRQTLSNQNHIIVSLCVVSQLKGHLTHRSSVKLHMNSAHYIGIKSNFRDSKCSCPNDCLQARIGNTTSWKIKELSLNSSSRAAAQKWEVTVTSWHGFCYIIEGSCSPMNEATGTKLWKWTGDRVSSIQFLRTLCTPKGDLLNLALEQSGREVEECQSGSGQAWPSCLPLTLFSWPTLKWLFYTDSKFTFSYL